MRTIREVKTGKKEYLDLLLLGDEQEDMIDCYLERGWMYVLEEHGKVRGVCVVTDEGDNVLEVKNIAVDPQSQRCGYGRALLSFLEQRHRNRFEKLKVGTGDSPCTIPFYQRCGFRECGRVERFFIDHYDHPIFECGVQLIDMIYLEKVIMHKR